MKLCDYQGYEIHIPTSGGKAGTGKNETSTIQIRLGNCIAKAIRFSMINPEQRSRAIQKAKDWIAHNPAAAGSK